MSGTVKGQGTSRGGLDLEKAASNRRNLQVTMRTQARAQRTREKRVKEADAGEAEAYDHFNHEGRVKHLNDLAEILYSPDPASKVQEILQATTEIRKMLSTETNPPIDTVIHSQPKIVPRLVEFLDNFDFPGLQFESAWALTNIASGTPQQTLVVVSSGAIPKFVNLLSSSAENIREQAVWGLGNIAGDSVHRRDLVLSHGALEPLLALINNNPEVATMRNAAWTLSNLLRGKPVPEYKDVAATLPTLSQLITHDDTDVLMDSLWAVSYASDGPNDRIALVIEYGIVQKVMHLLKHNSEFHILCPALRTVGNIVTGSDEQTQMVCTQLFTTYTNTVTDA